MSDSEPLSHQEVWDDSALIDSWNEALDEYKKYHSILAKGGTVKDLEDAVNSSSSIDKVADEAGPASKPKPDLEAVRVTDEPTENAEPTSNPPVADGRVPPGPPPQVLLGTVQDESLKKLLMAWYYAGYYTGLFEGQRQADQKQ